MIGIGVTPNGSSQGQGELETAQSGELLFGRWLIGLPDSTILKITNNQEFMVSLPAAERSLAGWIRGRILITLENVSDGLSPDWCNWWKSQEWYFLGLVPTRPPDFVDSESLLVDAEHVEPVQTDSPRGGMMNTPFEDGSQLYASASGIRQEGVKRSWSFTFSGIRQYLRRSAASGVGIPLHTQSWHKPDPELDHELGSCLYKRSWVRAVRRETSSLFGGVAELSRTRLHCRLLLLDPLYRTDASPQSYERLPNSLAMRTCKRYFVVIVG